MVAPVPTLTCRGGCLRSVDGTNRLAHAAALIASEDLVRARWNESVRKLRAAVGRSSDLGDVRFDRSIVRVWRKWLRRIAIDIRFDTSQYHGDDLDTISCSRYGHESSKDSDCLLEWSKLCVRVNRYANNRSSTYRSSKYHCIHEQPLCSRYM